MGRLGNVLGAFARVERGVRRMRVGLSKAKFGQILLRVLNTPKAALARPGASGLPTPAAITAGPLFFSLAVLESEFVEAGFFRK